MHLEYLLAVVQIGQLYVDLSVETPCTHQCFVQHIGTVGGCENDHATVGAESIHLCKELVECVLSLIIRSEVGVLTTCTTYSINLIDEDNAGSLLLCLTEQITYT